MSAKAWNTQQKAADEIYFQNDAVSLCLLVNRRARTMRIIDFRAGPTTAKRSIVLSLGKREGVDKAYTLVERDEVATWVKLGFEREGSIPGFYKRSDAFLLGWLFPAEAAISDSQYTPIESETRIVAAKEAESSDEREGAVDVAHDLAERTLARAKRLTKELADRSLPVVKVSALHDTAVRKPLAAALRSGRALTGFEPFGRDVERRYFSLTARGGFELIVSTESQACFENAFLEVLQAPKNKPSAWRRPERWAPSARSSLPRGWSARSLCRRATTLRSRPSSSRTVSVALACSGATSSFGVSAEMASFGRESSPTPLTLNPLAKDP
jgi:hypothetical protein